MQLIIENVRCFSGKYSVPIRQLTLLVGENSTGKSTFLALLSHVSQNLFPSIRPSFSTPPFDLGTFESIATFKRGRIAPAGVFSVGFETEAGGTTSRLVASYANSRGQPQLQKFAATGQEGEITVALDHLANIAKIAIKTSRGRQLALQADLGALTTAETNLALLMPVQAAIFNSAQRKEEDKNTTIFDMEAINALSLMHSGRQPALASAPVRTKPHRTYDVISDTFTPEGDHIPVILSRILQAKDDSRRADMTRVLNDFGKASTLFDRIGVRRLGKKPSDPFQILVNIAGPAVNLSDVGYGVSQALPVIVQSLLNPQGRMALLQQPEVHLHPRSQAALGSFFCRLVSAENKEFVIETHSDYLLDRIRVEVSNGAIKPDQVLILFFERKGVKTYIHPITMDVEGNLVDAPRSYRKFFLEEELRLMDRRNK